MVFEWAHWLKAERKKAMIRVRSSPSNSAMLQNQTLPPTHKYSFKTFYDTMQHALGYGSWWSVLLIFILVVLGGIGWINAWFVDKVSRGLRRFGILPPLVDSGEGCPDMVSLFPSQ